MAKTHGKPIFRFQRNLYTVFPSGCTCLHAHHTGLGTVLTQISDFAICSYGKPVMCILKKCPQCGALMHFWVADSCFSFLMQRTI